MAPRLIPAAPGEEQEQGAQAPAQQAAPAKPKSFWEKQFPEGTIGSKVPGALRNLVTFDSFTNNLTDKIDFGYGGRTPQTKQAYNPLGAATGYMERVSTGGVPQGTTSVTPNFLEQSPPPPPAVPVGGGGVSRGAGASGGWEPNKTTGTAAAVKDGVNEVLDKKFAPPAAAPAATPSATAPATPDPRAVPTGPDPLDMAYPGQRPPATPIPPDSSAAPELKPFDNKGVDAWIEGEISSGRMTRAQSWELQRGREAGIDPRNFTDLQGNFSMVAYKHNLRQADPTFATEEQNQALAANKDYQIRTRDAHHMIGKAQSLLMNSDKPWQVASESARLQEAGLRELADASKAGIESYYKAREAENAEYLNYLTQRGELAKDRRTAELEYMKASLEANKAFDLAKANFEQKQMELKAQRETERLKQELVNKGNKEVQELANKGHIAAAEKTGEYAVKAAGAKGETNKPLDMNEITSLNAEVEAIMTNPNLNSEQKVREILALGETDPRKAAYLRSKTPPATQPTQPTAVPKGKEGIAPVDPNTGLLPFIRKPQQ